MLKKGEKKKEKRDRKKLLEKHLEEETTAFDPRDYVVSPKNLWTKEVVIYKGTEKEHTRKLIHGKVDLKTTLSLKGDKAEQGIQMMFLMLKVADPSLKKEDIEKMDSEVATEILKAIYPGELPLRIGQKDSSAGSSTTRRRKP